MCLKVPQTGDIRVPQSGSELDPPSPYLASLERGCLEVPAAVGSPPLRPIPDEPLGGVWSPPSPPPVGTRSPPLFPDGEPATIPLHPPTSQSSLSTFDTTTAINMVLNCINMCVFMVSQYLASTETSGAHFAHRKQLRCRDRVDAPTSALRTMKRHEHEEDTLEHPHGKHVTDLLAWHIGVEDARWYVKPRSTCWFEEYLFNIYIPDMFYDILRMRRRTFDRLVLDLGPHIQGQQTHWRQPIGVEK